MIYVCVCTVCSSSFVSHSYMVEMASNMAAAASIAIGSTNVPLAVFSGDRSSDVASWSRAALHALSVAGLNSEEKAKQGARGPRVGPERCRARVRRCCRGRGPRDAGQGPRAPGRRVPVARRLCIRARPPPGLAHGPHERKRIRGAFQVGRPPIQQGYEGRRACLVFLARPIGIKDVENRAYESKVTEAKEIRT